MLPVEPATPTYLVETYLPGLTEAAVEAAAARATAAMSEGGPASEVDYLGAILVPADEAAFYLFAGHSAEAVRAAAEQAGVDVARVVESLYIGASIQLGPRRAARQRPPPP